MNLQRGCGSGPGSHHPIHAAAKVFAFPRIYNSLRAPAFQTSPRNSTPSRSNVGANLGAKTNTGLCGPPEGDQALVLTDAKIRAAAPLEKEWKLFDGGGLFLLIHPNGSRYWRLKYRVHGREGKLSFGVYPDVTLKEARARRDEAKAQLRDGINPSVEKRVRKNAGPNTFKGVALEWLEMLANPPQNPRAKKSRPPLAKKTLERRQGWLDDFVFPYIGSRPLSAIEAPELLDLLRRVEKRGFIETTHRVRSTCSRIFRYGIATNRCKRDPAADLIGALTPVTVTHHAAITEPRVIGTLLRAIDAFQGQFVTKVALKLLPLVFVRSSELRWATWQEFDLDAAEWRIPASRMKLKEMHVVPLARQAVEMLRELLPLTGDGDLVFRGLKPGRPISENTVNNALRLLGYTGTEMTGHGWRTVASTFLNEHGWHPDVIELQLAHKERDDVRGAYNQAQRLDDRRTMMQAWADYLDGLRAGGNVVAIRSNVG